MAETNSTGTRMPVTLWLTGKKSPRCCCFFFRIGRTCGNTWRSGREKR
jgi:hypothetical protein